MKTFNRSEFKKLPPLNRNLVAHGQPKGGEKVLYSITPEGRLKLHRDLSKYRIRKVGKHHYEYYEVAPSQREQEHNQKLKAVVSRFSQELSLDNECAIAKRLIKAHEAVEARV